MNRVSSNVRETAIILRLEAEFSVVNRFKTSHRVVSDE